MALISLHKFQWAPLVCLCFWCDYGRYLSMLTQNTSVCVGTCPSNTVVWSQGPRFILVSRAAIRSGHDHPQRTTASILPKSIAVQSLCLATDHYIIVMRRAPLRGPHTMSRSPSSSSRNKSLLRHLTEKTAMLLLSSSLSSSSPRGRFPAFPFPLRPLRFLPPLVSAFSSSFSSSLPRFPPCFPCPSSSSSPSS